MFSDKNEEETFSWRGDEETNFSDWTIEINNIDIYHVHRLIFSIGDRRCNYFSAVFRGNHAESTSCQSKISLEDPTVSKTFPVFLDYVYKLSTFTLDRENVVALMDLADYFGCPSLTELCVDSVVRKIINPGDVNENATNALEYLIQFFDVGHTNLVEIILPVFFGHLGIVTERLCYKDEEETRRTRSSDRYASKVQLTAGLFDFVMTSPYLNHAGILHGHSREMSEFVSRYLAEHNPDALCLDRLLVSTALTIMPILTPQAASRFLDMIQRVPISGEHIDWDCLAKLAVRCYDVLVPEEEADDLTTTTLVDNFVQTKSSRVSHMLAVARLTAQSRRRALDKETNLDLSMDQSDDEDDAERYEVDAGVDYEDISIEDFEEDSYEMDAHVTML